MLTRLWSNSWSEYVINDGNPNYLELSRFNIFIGPNNSGKSRFLRSVVGLDGVSTWHASDTMNTTQVEKFLSLIREQMREGDRLDDIDLPWIAKTISGRIYDSHSRNIIGDLGRYKSRIISGNLHGNLTRIGNLITALRNDTTDSQIFNEFKQPIPNKVYIPILRGMRPLNGKNSNLYKDRTHLDYPKINPECIQTGESIYKLLTENLLGLPNQRERIRDYEKLLSKYFFENQEINLIPKHDSDVVNILIGKDEQRPIFDVGDGLQQILIITSTVFLMDEEYIVCIEEPEINLHPGLLRQLIRFLLNETKHQYFVTTHSNHLLDFHDQSESCSLFKIYNSINNKKFHIHKIGKDRSILYDLGIKSSSVFISNCTIWVEGITDRLYIREFLKKIFKGNTGQEYIENYHFSFVEYQGGNLTHWEFDDEIDDELEFLKALDTTSAPFLIADGDIEKKGHRAAKLSGELGESFFLLSAKEIENYLPKDVIVYACKKLFETFRRDTFGLDIGGIDNIDYQIYKGSDQGLGHHIDKVLGCTGNQSIFSSESTTLKDKLKFCTFATEYMKTNDWELTPEISHLCEKIVSHIQRHNS